MAKAEYKSSLRSKRLIREAFLELIQIKQIEKITVADIVRHADINRGTFYAHYQDVSAILEAIENELVQILVDAFNDISNPNFFDSPKALILKYSKILESDLEFYRVLVSCGIADHVLNRIKTVFVEFMQHNTNTPQQLAKQPDFVIMSHYLAGGIVNVYQSWFKGDLQCTFEELADVISRDIMNIKNVLDLQCYDI